MTQSAISLYRAFRAEIDKLEHNNIGDLDKSVILMSQFINEMVRLNKEGVLNEDDLHDFVFMANQDTTNRQRLMNAEYRADYARNNGTDC